jgi:hypothetical protein
VLTGGGAMLEIALPKAAEERRRTIQVNAA